MRLLNCLLFPVKWISTTPSKCVFSSQTAQNLIRLSDMIWQCNQQKCWCWQAHSSLRWTRSITPVILTSSPTRKVWLTFPPTYSGKRTVFRYQLFAHIPHKVYWLSWTSTQEMTWQVIIVTRIPGWLIFINVLIPESVLLQTVTISRTTLLKAMLWKHRPAWHLICMAVGMKWTECWTRASWYRFTNRQKIVVRIRTIRWLNTALWLSGTCRTRGEWLKR